MILGLGRSPGRLPTPGFLGFLVAQLVKNLPAMWETWVGSLGWESPLEKGKAPHSSILAWRIPWTVLPRKVRLVEAMVFPVVMYGCESWTVKKAFYQSLT